MSCMLRPRIPVEMHVRKCPRRGGPPDQPGGGNSEPASGDPGSEGENRRQAGWYVVQDRTPPGGILSSPATNRGPPANPPAAGSRDQDLQRLDQLESLFESIRSAPLRVVDEIVREIRTAHGGLKKSLVAVGPWEGREGRSNPWSKHRDWVQLLMEGYQ